MIDYKEYLKTFEKDENGRFKNLSFVDERGVLRDFTGKDPVDLSFDEVVALKTHSGKLFRTVDCTTIER